MRLVYYLLSLPLLANQEAISVGTTRSYFDDATLVAPPRANNKLFQNKYGGGRGIRTPAGFNTPVGFQDRSLQPDLGIPPHIKSCNWWTL